MIAPGIEAVPFDKQRSEYCAAPGALLTLTPPELALSPDELVLHNFLDIPRPKELIREHRTAMRLIGEQGIPVLDIRDLTSEYSSLVKYNPNAMFVRDSVTVAAPWMDQVILARMGLKPRRAETFVVQQALQAIGAEVSQLELHPGDSIEGGDVIPAVFDGKRTLLIGFTNPEKDPKPRTTEGAIRRLHEELEANDEVDQIIMIRHPKEVLHLDTGLTLYSGPRDDDGKAAVIAEGMFEGAVLLDRQNPEGEEIDMNDFLTDHGFETISVDAKEAIEDEVCNVLSLGDGRYIGFDTLSRGLIRQIGEITDATILTTPGKEISKAAGGLHCLTHQLYGQAVLKHKRQERLI